MFCCSNSLFSKIQKYDDSSYPRQFPFVASQQSLSSLQGTSHVLPPAASLTKPRMSVVTTPRITNHTPLFSLSTGTTTRVRNPIFERSRFFRLLISSESQSLQPTEERERQRERERKKESNLIISETSLPFLKDQ